MNLLSCCINLLTSFLIFFLSNFQGYITAGSPQAALNVYEEILRLGLKPDRLTYNTLINACVKLEKLDAAMHILEEMKVSKCTLEALGPRILF